MEETCRETVITYHYKSETEMRHHEHEMMNDGWHIEHARFLDRKLVKRYSKIIPKGSFL